MSDTKNLEVDPETIGTAINDIKTKVGEMVKSQKILAKQNELLVANWVGSSCDSFLQAGISLENIYDDIIDALLKEIDYLQQYKDSLNVAEDNIYYKNHPFYGKYFQ